MSINLLNETFETDPADRGWELVHTHNGSSLGTWIARTDGIPGHIRAVDGQWQGPLFDVVPHQYYRLTFQSKAAIPGYWAAIFYDRDGKQLEADHNSGIDVSSDWIDQNIMFRAKADAAKSRLWFYPVSPENGHAIDIRNVEINRAENDDVLAWADQLYAGIPPIAHEVPGSRWQHIPRAMEKLRNGQKLRIVILGDSIGCDTGNAPIDLLLQRHYPNCTVELITSVRGGTGCTYYREEDKVEDYVLRYQPDLVMIIAISHGYDLEAIRDVVQQIRAGCDAEVMLASAPIAPENEMLNMLGDLEHGEALKQRKSFLEGMERVAADEKAEFVPMRRYWNAYLAQVADEREPGWFMRDTIHANTRGSQVAARMWENYFAPNSE